jgi:hypothetical protein
MTRLTPYAEQHADKAQHHMDSAVAAYRTLVDARKFVAANRHRLNEIWEDVPCPPLTIAEHLAGLSPQRRAELEQEWQS